MNPGESLLLLIIDDDPDQLALARIAAQKAGGLRVMAAESGGEALNQLQTRAATSLDAPDVVLSDLKMPGMSGLELMRNLRSRPETQNVPVIFLTSSAYNRDRIVAHMAGANGFFQKPVRFNDLVDFMKALPSYVPVSRPEQPAPPPPVTQDAESLVH